LGTGSTILETLISSLVDPCFHNHEVLEYVSEDQGGGVKLAKAHYDGLNQSTNKNFEWSGLIASMEQFNGFFFLGTRTYFHG
jgi:hypothetical protein